MGKRRTSKAISKSWARRLKKIDEEHPIIQHNPWQFRYAGADDWWFDLNDKYDPTEEMENRIDGYEPPPPPPKDYEGREKLAHKMLRHLTKKERKIVKEKLFKNKSFAQIGREMGYTRQNIKYHYDKSIKKLQDKYNEKQ